MLPINYVTNCVMAMPTYCIDMLGFIVHFQLFYCMVQEQTARKFGNSMTCRN